MPTNGYHPAARCTEAARLYFVWIKLAQQHPKNAKVRMAAYEEYMAHISGGCDCRKGLRDEGV